MKKSIICLLLSLVLLLSLLPAGAMAEYSAMYNITVIGGTAAWVDANPDAPQGQKGTQITAPAGATVSLVADDFLGNNFWKWKVIDGHDVTFENSTRQATAFKMPAGDVVIKAMSDSDKDEEGFDIGGLITGEYSVTVINGTASHQKASFLNKVTITANEPPAGMKFSNWNVVKGTAVVILQKNNPESSFLMIKDDVVVEAVFVKDDDQPTEDGKYAVNVEGGTASASSAAPGDIVAIVVDSDKSGSFTKWQVVGGNVTLASETSSPTTFVMPAEPVTVRAVSVGDDTGMYSITVTGGGYASKTRANAGDTVTLYTNNFEASNFMYWECADSDVQFESANKAITTFTMPAHDVEIKAVSLTGKTICTYKINNGVISGGLALPDSREGSAIRSQSYTVTADAPPSGMVFDKWVLNSAAASAVIVSPEKATTTVWCLTDFEITATYKSNGGGQDPVDPPVGGTCYILYDANGGSGSPSSQTFRAGEKVTLSTTKPTREGYSFLGWSDDASDTESVYSSGRAYSFDATTVLYAIWKKNDAPVLSYPISVTNGTASVSSAKAGDTVTVTLSPSASGRFSHWEANEGVSFADFTSPTTQFTMPAKAVSIQAVMVSEPNPQALRAFVSRLYSVCLGREAAENEIEHYVWLLTDQGETGISVASKFIFSREFAMKNYCNRHYTQALYRAFMGREPQDFELDYGEWRLQQGDTRVELFNEWASSTEFQDICENAGIVLGSPITENDLDMGEDGRVGAHQGGYCKVADCTAHESICEFVENLYVNSFGRYPSQAEIDAWHYNLVHGNDTGTSAARFFFHSEEFTKYGYDSAAYVLHLYLALFNRTPDANEQSYWVNELEENGCSRDAVFEQFVKEIEFAYICQQHNVIL